MSRVLHRAWLLAQPRGGLWGAAACWPWHCCHLRGSPPDSPRGFGVVFGAVCSPMAFWQSCGGGITSSLLALGCTGGRHPTGDAHPVSCRLLLLLQHGTETWLGMAANVPSPPSPPAGCISVLVPAILRSRGFAAPGAASPSLSLPAKPRVKRRVHLPDGMRHELINVCMIF